MAKSFIPSELKVFGGRASQSWKGSGIINEPPGCGQKFHCSDEALSASESVLICINHTLTSDFRHTCKRWRRLKWVRSYSYSKSGCWVDCRECRLNAYSSLTQQSKILILYSNNHIYSVLGRHKTLKWINHPEANICGSEQLSKPAFPHDPTLARLSLKGPFPHFDVGRCVRCHHGCHDPPPVIPRSLWLMITEIHGWSSSSRLVSQSAEAAAARASRLLIKVELEETEPALPPW